jgi:hypothetical protein
MDAPAIPDNAPNFFALTSTLAMELASQLTSPTEVFARHGFSEDDAKLILADPTFRNMIKEAKAEWGAEQNTAERIKLKAQMALEELLLPTFTMAKDPRVPPPARMDASKMFERLSGVSKETEGNGGGGPKFVLNINVGSDGPKEIVGEVIEQDG